MLAKSWNDAAPAANLTKGVTASYDKYQRAYLLQTNNPAVEEIVFTVQASASSPVCNLPVVIENWNSNAQNIMVNNKLQKAGKDYTIGNVTELAQNKVVIFIKIKTNSTIKVQITNR